METVPLSENAGTSHTLPAAVYTDPQILDLEKHTVFFHSWLCVGHVCELESVGNYTTREVFDQSVAIIKGSDNEIRAFFNVCSHRAHELLSGSGHTDRIQCPYHAWSYHINGKVNEIPGSENMDLQIAEFCLKSVRLEIFANMMFINLDPEAPSLKSLAPQIPEEIARLLPQSEKICLLSDTSHQLKSNWKVAIDNFVEFYHYGPTHHSEVELSNSDYQIFNYPYHIAQIATPGAAARQQDTEITPEELHKSLAFWYLWPNTGISLFPGAPFFVIVTFEPDDVETSRIHLKLYGVEDAIDRQSFEEFRRARYSILEEDIAACESVQRGLHSMGYNQGRFIVDEDRQLVSENGVHHFHRMVLRALES